MDPKNCPHSTWIPDEAPDYRCAECGVLGRRWFPKPWQKNRGIAAGTIVSFSENEQQKRIANHRRNAKEAVRKMDEGDVYSEYDPKTTAEVDNVLKKKRKPT